MPTDIETPQGPVSKDTAAKHPFYRFHAPHLHLQSVFGDDWFQQSSANAISRAPARALHRPGMIRALVLLAMMAFPMPLVAAPPDGADPNSQLGIWYRSLKVPGTGQSCCNVSDCRPVDTAWIEGDHWRARIGDAIIDIPASRVLRRENPDGRGILCRSVWEVLCFVPPSGA